MATKKILKLVQKWIIKLGLEDWTIRVFQTKDKNPIQVTKNEIIEEKNYGYAVTNILPTSKIAEIYILDELDIERTILHELLHLKTARWVFGSISNIEKFTKSKQDAIELHIKLREKEHKIINELERKYLKELN